LAGAMASMGKGGARERETLSCEKGGARFV